MKLQTLEQAIETHVPDGSSVLIGAALEALVPFAAGYEIIRQKRRRLTLVAPISDMLFDVLIGAGVAERVVAAWVGNVSAGLGHNFRRAVENKDPAPLEVIDHSNFTLALAVHAQALGVPYLPTRSTFGTDLLKANPHLRRTECPYTGDALVAVEALAPDVSILAVQRADEHGNAHAWGNLGVTFDAARAAKRVIVLAHEIVPEDAIRADPSRTVIPGFLTAAVVHVPRGCHPAPCHDCYGRDHSFFQEYHDVSRTREGFLEWLDRYVLSVDSHEDYLKRVDGRSTS